VLKKYVLEYIIFNTILYKRAIKSKGNLELEMYDVIRPNGKTMRGRPIKPNSKHQRELREKEFNRYFNTLVYQQRIKAIELDISSLSLKPCGQQRGQYSMVLATDTKPDSKVLVIQFSRHKADKHKWDSPELRQFAYYCTLIFNTEYFKADKKLIGMLTRIRLKAFETNNHHNDKLSKLMRVKTWIYRDAKKHKISYSSFETLVKFYKESLQHHLRDWKLIFLG